jgi:uncharacterized repeat protein (TIGR02543 family)
LGTTTFQSNLKNGHYLIPVKGFSKGTTNTVTISAKDSSALGNTNTRKLYFNYTTVTPPFTVTYNGNTNTAGAPPVDPGKYEIGATVTVKDNTGNMVKVGYTFVGWNTAADGNGTAYKSGVTFPMGTANVTLYAQWTTMPTFTVTYNGNGNTGGTVPVDANKYVPAGTVTVKDNTGLLVKTGTSFAGWNTAADGNGTTYAGGGSFPMGSADVVLYAKWTTKPVYSVTFNSNGGSGTMTDLSIESGMSVPLTANTFTKSGSVFTGWATTAIGTTVEYADKASYTMGASNVTLYAIWSQNAAYKIIFNSNGGTGTMADQSIVSGISAPLTANAFTKSGSVFAGWATTATGTTVEYADKASYTMGGSNVTLFAIWSQNTAYKISFNSNGGTGTMADQSIVSGISAPLTANAFTKSGSVFAGWATTATGTTVEYADKASYTMGGSNVSLFAIWTQNPAFKVTFNSNGGTGTMVDQSIVQGLSAPLTANIFAKTGSVFAGWATTATGTTVEYADNANFTMGGSNVILYAIWSQNPIYKVTFNSNGGTGTMADQSIVSGISTPLSQNTFTKTGSTFAGWMTTATGTTAAFTDKANYTMGGNDVTLYALWSQNPSFKITFNGNGGTGTMAQQSVVQGTNVTLSVNTFTRAGHQFAGWATTPTGTATYQNQAVYTMGSSDIDLYALWTQNPSFTVTFNSNGGTGTMSAQSIVQGITAALTANSFTKTGSTFAGWTSSATGTTVEFVNSANYTMGAGNVTLYALWTQNPSFSITFNSNTGTGTMLAQSIVQGTSAALTANAFTKTGSTFAGWASSATGTTVEFPDRGNYAMGGSNVTLYALWTQNPSYSITFNNNGGSGTMSSQAIVQGITAALTANSFTKIGSTFTGWTSAATGTTVEFSDRANYTMGGSNVTLYAVWVKKQYTLTYNDNNSTNGSVPDGGTYDTNTTVTVASNSGSLVRTGYTFGGWNTNAGGTGTNYTAGTGSFSIRATTILYAKWNAIPTYSLTYNANGATGTVPSGGSYQANTNVTVASYGSLVKNKFTFDNWNTQADGRGSSYAVNGTINIGTTNVTLYARWKPSGMVKVTAGTFQMGQTGVTGATPVHEVTLTKNYWMDNTEVTQTDFSDVITTVYGSELSLPDWAGMDKGTGPRVPAYGVTWAMAALYCNGKTKLSGSMDTVYSYTSRSVGALEGITIDVGKNGFRLPTEAEWEYACRAGTTTLYYWGSSSTNIATYAYWTGDADSKFVSVASSNPNNWNLYDMIGSVAEWVNDRGVNNYTAGAQTDPLILTNASYSARVARGGSVFTYSVDDVTCASRESQLDYMASEKYGFRVVMNAQW